MFDDFQKFGFTNKEETALYKTTLSNLRDLDNQKGNDCQRGGNESERNGETVQILRADRCGLVA